jgi:hypothetical protein
LTRATDGFHFFVSRVNIGAQKNAAHCAAFLHNREL